MRPRRLFPILELTLYICKFFLYLVPAFGVRYLSVALESNLSFSMFSAIFIVFFDQLYYFALQSYFKG